MNIEQKKSQIFLVFEQALLSVFGARVEFLTTCRQIIDSMVENIIETENNEKFEAASLLPLYQIMQKEKVPEHTCKNVLIFFQSKTQGRQTIFAVPEVYKNLAMRERREILRKMSRKISEHFPESTDKNNVAMNSQEVSQKKYIGSPAHGYSRDSFKAQTSAATSVGLKVSFGLVLLSAVLVYFLVLNGNGAESIVLEDSSNILTCAVLKGKKPNAVCVVDAIEVLNSKVNLQSKIYKTADLLKKQGYSNISIVSTDGKFLLQPQ